MSAGAPLPLELEKQVFEETGLKIHNFYGASECGGIAYDRTERPRARATLVGTPLDGVTLWVDQSGHMVVNGENVGFGYWPNTDPDEPLGMNQFTLPDLVEITTEGVDLIGRRTDAINVAGRKVSPSEIECALLTHPQVRHCVVFGVPSGDSSRVEDIVACVNAGENIGITEIGEHLTGRLQGWQIPRKWLFTESLEPNDRGKISRSHWRAFYLNKPAP
jgi:long-chain acyl-CoA synthetase